MKITPPDPMGVKLRILKMQHRAEQRRSYKFPSKKRGEGVCCIYALNSPPILGGVARGRGGKWKMKFILSDQPPLPLLNQGGKLKQPPPPPLLRGNSLNSPSFPGVQNPAQIEQQIL